MTNITEERVREELSEEMSEREKAWREREEILAHEPLKAFVLTEEELQKLREEGRI